MKLEDVKTEQFNEIIRDLARDGWRKTDEYKGIDAWIDYGLVTFEQNGKSIRCEWTNWDEGSFEAPDATIAELKRRYSV